MPPEPVPADPGPDEDLAWLDRDPEREVWLDRARDHDEPPGEDEEYEDYAPLTAAELAEIREAAADELLAVKAATTGRRGPGQPGSARTFPGESSSPAAAFGPGMALDVLPGCAGLAMAADAAAGEDDRFAGVSEAELIGVVCAWDRVETHAHARKLAAVAELARRNPAPPDQEFTADEVACALGESRDRAESLIDLAQTLETHLPGTAAALDDGTISRYKAEIIARATAFLDPDEARAAEQEVLDRAGRLTPGALRAAIARAVVKAAPEKAETASAERGEGCPRGAVDPGLRQRRADGLRAAPGRGTGRGSADHRPGERAEEGGPGGRHGPAPRPRLPRPAPRQRLPPSQHRASRLRARPAPPCRRRVCRPGTLTVPLATLAGLADRPGELAGLGPVDPWLARDLAAAAARNPSSTWCVTVTDEHGHAIGHGCARPEPRRHRKRAGPGPPGGTEFIFTQASRDGPPGGYGTWTLRTPGNGPDLTVALDSLTTDPCDHRHQASGHDPGVKLRHLSQIRHATCTSPVCRRPAAQCDHEHNTPYEAGGRSCLCNTGPKCRHDHRLKQHPKWHVDQLPDGTFHWTAPSGRTYTTEPTRYPI